MALGCLTASFPTATCFLVGVTNRLFGLDIIGPLGVVLVFVALLIALAIARQVWLHPEGFKPPIEE
jgi:hypothetical protein